jgi:hypothetical protein
MSVKVTGEKLADTRSKVSLAPPDRLRLGTLVLFLAKQPKGAVASSAFRSLLIVITAR